MQIQTQRAAAILETYLRERVKHRDTTGVILGLSGGLDSAVLATLAVRSLGSSRVRVLYLFDRDSSRNSEKKAEVIAGWLGLRLEKQDMTPAMQARDVYRPLVARFSNISALLNCGVAILYQRITGESPLVSILRHGSGECQDHTMKQKLYDVFVRPLAEGYDARHRYRREILESMASRDNLELIGAANYSECMIGWFVKDGIDDVPVQPLMKLYKTQVQELAQYLNVPEKVRGSRPAPDMQKGITDEFGIRLSYRRLDQILDAWHQGLSDPAIVQQGIMQEELQKVRQLHQLSAWKQTSSHEVPPVDGLPGSVLRKDSVMRSDTGALWKS